jgi:hypothetical protein
MAVFERLRLEYCGQESRGTRPADMVAYRPKKTPAEPGLFVVGSGLGAAAAPAGAIQPIPETAGGWSLLGHEVPLSADATGRPKEDLNRLI